MRLFGDGPVAVRSLSLLAALAMVPAAYWAWPQPVRVARGMGPAPPWPSTSPYLSLWGREARMYTLLALLALVAVTAFLHAFAFGRRRWIPGFVVSLGPGLLHPQLGPSTWPPPALWPPWSAPCAAPTRAAPCSTWPWPSPAWP